MEPILTDREITTILTSVGYKEKEQPDGSVALNPYVFTGAHVLIERALSKTLVLRNRLNSKQGIIVEGLPTNNLAHIQSDYSHMGDLFVKDMQRLQPLLDRLQCSICFRQNNAAMLWNVAVMDKCGDLIASAIGCRLGVGMHHTIQTLEKVCDDIPPNTPFFPKD